MTIWLTADTHFSHANIIRYCNRPFQNVHEMNKELTERWNVRVKPDDTVYHLGDFAFGNPRVYLKHLNGHIHLLRGTHDKIVDEVGFASVSNLLVIRVQMLTLVLCHYAMRVWPHSNHGSYHLFGHSHGKLPPHGLSFDVGVDTHDYYPWSMDEVVDRMQSMKTCHTVKDTVECRRSTDETT